MTDKTTETQAASEDAKRPVDVLVSQHEIVDAFLSLESTAYIYIAHEDGLLVEWQRFKEYSIEDMSPEMMRAWAAKLMTFSKQLSSMSEQAG